MGKVDWQDFWETYRKTDVQSERDLFFQVGKTVNQQPIPQASFKLSLELVARDLELSVDDKLVELCCGNGLMTLPLASLVNEVYAVDFASHLIENARRFRQAPNVTYVTGDAVTCMSELARNRSYIPSKILLSDALGYFDPESLRNILHSAGELMENRVMVLATGIPSDELKWNFYNTPDRVSRYQENQRLEINTNDGLGRWWRLDELEQLARDCGLVLTVKRQPQELSTFRVDAIFGTTLSPRRCR
jgi:protein-L-isoaspartate O-methyltransferase